MEYRFTIQNTNGYRINNMQITMSDFLKQYIQAYVAYASISVR